MVIQQFLTSLSGFLPRRWRLGARWLMATLVSLALGWGWLGIPHSHAQSAADLLMLPPPPSNVSPAADLLTLPPPPSNVSPSLDTAELIEADFPLDPSITVDQITGLESLELEIGQEIVIEPVPEDPAGQSSVPVVFTERSSGTTYRITPERGLEIVRPTDETESATAALPTQPRIPAGDERLRYPLPSPVPITSRFGLRVHPIRGSQEFHQGVDLGAPEGMPILAAFSGDIVEAGAMGGLGNAVSLAHGSHQRTRYGHMSAVATHAGQHVNQGDVIGYVGATGMATGPHLHFELWERIPEGNWVAMDTAEDLTVALAALGS